MIWPQLGLTLWILAQPAGNDEAACTAADDNVVVPGLNSVQAAPDMLSRIFEPGCRCDEEHATGRGAQKPAEGHLQRRATGRGACTNRPRGSRTDDGLVSGNTGPAAINAHPGGRPTCITCRFGRTYFDRPRQCRKGETGFLRICGVHALERLKHLMDASCIRNATLVATMSQYEKPQCPYLVPEATVPIRQASVLLPSGCSSQPT